MSACVFVSTSVAHQSLASAKRQPGSHCIACSLRLVQDLALKRQREAYLVQVFSRQDARRRISPDSRRDRNCGVVFRVVAPEYLETHRSLAAASGKLSAKGYCVVQ